MLFSHSSCAEPGIVGMAQVASTPYPDPTHCGAKSPYFNAQSKPGDPRWLLVDVRVRWKTRHLTPPELRADTGLEGLVVLRKGNRLSITPVEPPYWPRIVALLGEAAG